MSQAQRFGRLTQKAVKKLEFIIDMAVLPSDENFVRLIAIQKDAAATVVSLALKADESRFRAQSLQGIHALLEEVRKMQATQPVDAPVEPPNLLQSA